MDKPEEEITRKGDQYAKRLLVRKKDLNQSFESFSKSLRRRKKIMDAISRNRMTAGQTKPANKLDELANSDEDGEQEEAEKSYVSTWPDKCNLPAEAVESWPAGRSRSPSPVDEMHYPPRRSTGQFRQDFLAGLLHHEPAGTPQSRSPATKLHPKISLGEYFGAKSHEEMRATNFLSKLRPSGHGKTKHKQQPEQEFLSERVLRVLEPEVVHVERESHIETSKSRRVSSTTFARDSTLSAYVTAERTDSGEVDRRQIEKQPPDTPKTSRMYPSLSSMERRMSDRCSVVLAKKLYFESVQTAAGTERAADECLDEGATHAACTRSIVDESECFGTTMPSDRPDGPNETTLQFSRAEAYLQQTRRRYKPDLESTRKQQLSASQLMHGTSISTLTLPNTPGSPFTALREDETRDAGARATIPLEVENFLKVALGEEYQESCCATPVQDRATFKTTTAVGIEPKAARESKHPSALLDRSLSIYKSLSSSIRRRFKVRGKREPRLVLRHGGDGGYDEDEETRLRRTPKVQRLLDLMEVYQTQIYQASKALNLCEAMREFQASGERVEVERLLLLANLGKLAARDELGQLGGNWATVSRPVCERAELVIAELSVPLREDVLRRRERLQGVAAPDCVEWFVLVVRQGLRVWASQAVACPLDGPRLHFPGKLSLPEVAPDFRLSVGVYSMRLQCPRQLYNHEDKYHIERQSLGDLESSCPCPSPQRFLGGKSSSAHQTQAVRSPKQYHVSFSGVKRSGFLLRASLEIGLDQLDPPRSSWPLRLAQDEDSVLRTSLDMELRCRLRLEVRHAGFLTLGDEPGGVIDWSRRWCALEGRSLLFWNYPREQEDGKPPQHAIDLLSCLSRRVDLAERSLCPRPRTLLIETARRRSPADEDSMVLHCRRSWTIVRNLLSCDTQQDLLEWQSKLNHVVTALREWNLISVIETESGMQVSDL